MSFSFNTKIDIEYLKDCIEQHFLYLKDMGTIYPFTNFKMGFSIVLYSISSSHWLEIGCFVKAVATCNIGGIGYENTKGDIG